MAVNERHGGGAASPERDVRLDRLYQETAREAPPAHLDSAILAAARRAAGSRPRPLSAQLRRWRVPVSIAAVVVMSASLVMLMREEGADRVVEMPPVTPPAAEAPAAPPALSSRPEPQGSLTDRGAAEEFRAKVGADADKPAPEAFAQVIPPAQPSAPLPDAAGEVRRRTDARVLTAPGLAHERAPGAPALKAPPSAPASANEPAAGGRAGVAGREATREDLRSFRKVDPRMERDAAPEPSAGPAAAADVPAAPPAAQRQRVEVKARVTAGERSPDVGAAALAALLKELDQQPAEKWLERIEELKRQGRTDEVDEALAEFKRRFPTHPLPPGLR